MLNATFIVFTDNHNTTAMGATRIQRCFLLLFACFAQGQLVLGIYKAGIHIEMTSFVIMTSPSNILYVT